MQPSLLPVILVIFQFIRLISTSPFSRITVLCGKSHVAHAKIKFYEFGDDDMHSEIDSLHDFTDQLGHYHFPKHVAFEKITMDSVKLTIRDQCGIERKTIKCNLPYYHFEIPLEKLFSESENRHRQVILDLSDPIWEPYRGIHCL